MSFRRGKQRACLCNEVQFRHAHHRDIREGGRGDFRQSAGQISRGNLMHFEADLAASIPGMKIKIWKALRSALSPL